MKFLAYVPKLRSLLTQCSRGLKQLSNVQNWLKPKTVLWLLAGWMIYSWGNLLIKWLELELEERFKSPGISVEYGKILTLAPAELDVYLKRMEFGIIDRSLDDDILTNYFVIPLQFHNFTRNPVGTVGFIIDVDCAYAKIIDVKNSVRAPKVKNIAMRHKSPELKWTFSTNELLVKLGWGDQPGEKFNLYCSFAKDRGFGRVNAVPLEGNNVTLHMAPNRELSHWYFRLATASFWGESPLTDVLVAPNSLYLNGFKPVNEDITNKLQIPAMTENAQPFQEGRTTISFETGLDPEARIDVCVFGKVAAGESLRPFVKMEGAPGILFKEKNSPPNFIMPGKESYDKRKMELTPVLMRAVAASDTIVIFWKLLGSSTQSKIQVFRSHERAVGDYSSVGELVFDACGSTNTFEIQYFTGGDLPILVNNYPTNFSKFFNHAPTSGLNKLVSIPQREKYNFPKPLPPVNLRISSVEKFEGYLHFTDMPPKRDVGYTYTIFIVDNSGNQSYPVIVNAALYSSATNCTFRLH